MIRVNLEFWFQANTLYFLLVFYYYHWNICLKYNNASFKVMWMYFSQALSKGCSFLLETFMKGKRDGNK